MADDLREVTNQSPNLWLRIHQMLDGDCGVRGEASVGDNTQHHGIACVPKSRGGSEVEFIAHAQLGIPAFVEVQGAGGQVLQYYMVKKGRGVVEDGIGVCKVVRLQHHKGVDVYTMQCSNVRGLHCMHVYANWV